MTLIYKIKIGAFPRFLVDKIKLNKAVHHYPTRRCNKAYKIFYSCPV